MMARDAADCTMALFLFLFLVVKPVTNLLQLQQCPAPMLHVVCATIVIPSHRLFHMLIET
jgi:hypothetical protein